MLGWVVACVVGGVALIATVQHVAQRGSYRPLSSRQPQRDTGTDTTPLGMEATDLSLIARVNRRNESLERGHTNWTRPRSGLGKAAQAAETEIAPLPDDETYAKRFYTAFIKNKSKDIDT